MNKVIILVPAYNPGKSIVNLTEELSIYSNIEIIVVNDGSEEKHEKYFMEIAKKCIILKNEKNCGKGNALKKGFKYILENYQECNGVVTADADGQHTVKDIIHIKEMLEKEKVVILGCRNFNKKNIPLKNKIANKIMKKLVKVLRKVNIEDTQTGLRAIPTEYLKEMAQIKGERYEYEMNVLLYIIKHQIKFKQIPIDTVYKQDQKTFFRNIRDSFLVVKSFWK